MYILKKCRRSCCCYRFLQRSFTELIPELSALVGHGRALRLPEEEPRVGEELVRDERQHSGAVRISSA